MKTGNNCSFLYGLFLVGSFDYRCDNFLDLIDETTLLNRID